MLIGGYLIVAGIEAMILGLISLVIFSGLAPFPLTVIDTLVMMVCLAVYLLLLGNYIISMGLLIDTVTTLFLITFITFIFILFGNGFIIEFGFFPAGIENFLRWQPLSIPYQAFQLFIRSGIIDWALLFSSLLLGLLWMLGNTTILKRKLRH